MELDLSLLDSRVFTAFSQTTKRMYVYLCNMQTNVSRWAKNAVDYFGLPGEYIFNAGRIWEAYIHEEDREMYRQDIEALFSGKKERHSLQYRVRNKMGVYVLVSCEGIVLHGENGEPDFFAGTITNHGIVENVDPITNLYNIYEFMNAIRQALDNNERGLVMMIGVNQFSNFNAIYGYAFGNRILVELASQVKQLIAGRGILFRMDGAKFALWLPGGAQEDAKQLYASMQRIARGEIRVENTLIPIGLSGGAVVIDNFSGTVSSVRSCVVYALERSKHERRGELVIFDNELQENNTRMLEVLNIMRQSILTGFRGFSMRYQPLVDVSRGSIYGFEALVRWRDDRVGEVSPGVFIPWIENDAGFFDLGNWILAQALGDFAPLLREDPGLILNVNVSHTQLEHTGFRDAVMDALRKTGVPPGNLCLELTERCRMLNIDDLREEMRFFCRMGIQIALDDFGTGISSMGLIRELPISSIKVDRSFISGIIDNFKDQAIVDMICGCAERLGMKVCLEGVENEEIRRFIARYSAECHQGYYYAKPMTIEAVNALIQGSAPGKTHWPSSEEGMVSA